MPVSTIAISSTGRGLALLKKSIEIGAEFVISLPKNPEKLQEALKPCEQFV
jgi:signal transduction histidine kinase